MSQKITPVPNPTASYWLSEPHWLNNHRSTPELPSHADIVIIGTGIAGVSTAYHLTETYKLATRNRNSNLNDTAPPSHQGQRRAETPPPSILILEARTVCSGATGRNGGHIKKLPSTINELIQVHGFAVAGEIVRFIKENIYAVKDVIEKEAIAAEAELRRSLDVCLDEDDANAVREEYEKLREDGFPLMEDVGCITGNGDKGVVERITSLHGAEVALSTPVLSLWPYKFVTQLLELVLRTGHANLQTNTPVTAIETQATEQSGDREEQYVIKTPRGDIKTSTVILATNGYTAGLLPQYHNVITPAKATASHIAVPPDHYPPYLSNTYNIRHASDRVDYLNPRPDGGIVVGGGKEAYRDHRELWYDVFDDSTLVEPARHYFDGLMQRHFRGWEESGAVTEKVWTGIQGITKDGMPHIGKVPGTSGQYVLAGYNGGGMALAFLAAKGVAKMVGYGVGFSETGVPECMKTTRERMGKGQ
ncbi:FAD dependent oxidoreductase [Aspergillus violaceofuscus CBS 115571]|uniref:FAD dependent oxidoreductase n=1 Tax=Aspergillus violaceofuscus (strain CBS 115571) TaxID=1450538 RepID=A0A2V5GX62_ASPV1|nr:FAD dependent oxidoreductase [Aspergillus violaceofuscus CBS 115571]